MISKVYVGTGAFLFYVAACGDTELSPDPGARSTDAGAAPTDAAGEDVAPTPSTPRPTPTDPPVEPPPVLPGTIAFVCEFDDGANDELCLMDDDGGRVRRLTHNAGPDRAPNWSPDGRRLVFNSRRPPHADRPQIYRFEIEANELARVSDSVLEDQRGSWTHDGAAVVFQRGTFASGFELYRQTLADGSLVALTDEPGTISAAGSYSPDGHRLLFQSNRASDSMFPFATYVLNLASGELEALAADVTDSHDGPRWSPDGSRVAFAAGGNLYVVTVADGAVETLTDDEHADSAPAWSPDGRALVFQSDRIDEERTSLHVLDLDRREISNLGFGRTPVWTAKHFDGMPADAGAPDAAADPCAPHGTLHGDHCDCEDGYVESGLSCVPE